MRSVVADSPCFLISLLPSGVPPKDEFVNYDLIANKDFCYFPIEMPFEVKKYIHAYMGRKVSAAKAKRILNSVYTRVQNCQIENFEISKHLKGCSGPAWVTLFPEFPFLDTLGLK